MGDYRSYNLGLTTIGLVLIITGLPFVILSCGFFFQPEGVEALFVGVNMSDTSIGVAFNNLGLAWAGGALTGAAIAYWKRSYIYLLLGPLGGIEMRMRSNRSPTLRSFQLPWKSAPLSAGAARHVLSVMLTCGMYDSAGDWVSTVGIPAKSGISGGIIGASPGRAGIAA